MPAAGPSWILELRHRLGTPPPRRLPPPGEARQAAVLVPLFVTEGQLWTWLTRRSETLPQHKGQIAFPGGGRNAGEDLWAAALREAEEEVGLDRKTALPLGELDELEASSGYRVIPCVAAVPAQFAPRANPAEISELFRLPLLALTQPRAVEERPVRINGRERRLRVYHVGNRRVWGLTALILENLLHRLGLATPSGVDP
jgi:8-oxo-dGTP pyrophosphatase MutT (NUDIX family)